MSCKFGVYNFSHPSGSFEVALRPNGTFYCAKFPAQATWQAVGNKIYVDFANYGQYEFHIGADTSVIEGHARGDVSKWRKMIFARDFTESEMAILGAGFGTVWNFEWEKGAFEIEFRVDGYNHFVCNQFPSHSHWSMGDDQTLHINWSQYGEYVMRLDPATRSFVGHKKDQPANWRRATFLRALNSVDSAANVPAHDHAHVHTEACSH